MLCLDLPWLRFERRKECLHGHFAILIGPRLAGKKPTLLSLPSHTEATARPAAYPRSQTDFHRRRLWSWLSKAVDTCERDVCRELTVDWSLRTIVGRWGGGTQRYQGANKGIARVGKGRAGQGRNVGNPEHTPRQRRERRGEGGDSREKGEVSRPLNGALLGALADALLVRGGCELLGGRAQFGEGRLVGVGADVGLVLRLLQGGRLRGRGGEGARGRGEGRQRR